jgi:cytochrome P450
MTDETGKDMSDVVPTEFVTSEQAARDPNPANAALRARGPVHRIDFPPDAPAYLVVDYEHARRAFTDTRLSKRLDKGPSWFRERMVRNSPVLTDNLLSADAPDHTRLRNLVSRAFTPRSVERLRPRIQEIVDDLIDDFPVPGVVDLMRSFALPLPLTVICEFLGAPVEDHHRFERWAVVLSQSAYADGDDGQRRRQTSDEARDYFVELLAQRRQRPREDLFSDLIRAADGDGMFTDEELVSTGIFLIIAGHKTTANLIGNGMHALLTHPDQLALLRADPSLVTSAVEEILRFGPPVERSSLRFATEDLVIGGQQVPRGSFVHVSVGAVARDPAEFADPDRFDIARTPNPHMAFGHGPHFCAGAPLARLEGVIAFETLLRRLPTIDLAAPADQLTWVADSSISRGLHALPVRVAGRRPR